MYAQYARIAFCQESAVASWSCGAMCNAVGVPARVRVLPKGSSWGVKSYIAQLSDHRCVLAFRGTADLKNWEADFHAASRPWPDSGASWCRGCRVHNGFAKAYGELRPFLLGALQDMTCKSIGIVGHSLGAALATLAGIDLSAGLGFAIQPLYTLGSPRVGNTAFAEAFSHGPSGRSRFPVQWRLVHYDDPVPHLPPHVLPHLPFHGDRNYQHTPQEVWYNRNFDKYKLCDPLNGEDLSCSLGSFPSTLPDDHLNYFNMSFRRKDLPKECAAFEFDWPRDQVVFL